ncbi:MAG: TrkA family potassium uptake protein [Treponemataceae bacterium]
MKPKTFTVMGLGLFGMNAAKTLADLNQNVIVIDSDEEKINLISNYVSEAYVADISVPGVLEDIGIQDSDVVIVAVGEYFEEALLATLKCYDLGIKEIIVKSSSATHSRILEKIGATMTVIPEEQSAVKLAHSLVTKNLIDIVQLAEGYSIAEIIVPESWVGHSIIELDIRKKYDISVIAVMHENTVKVNPSATEVFQSNDRIFVLGKNVNIKQLEQ